MVWDPSVAIKTGEKKSDRIMFKPLLGEITLKQTH